MSRYDEAKDAIGPGPTIPARSGFTTYFGYNNGTVVGKFPTSAEAKAAGATLVGDKQFDQEGYDDARKAYYDHNEKVMKDWYARMRADHHDLNDAVFGLVYSEAYERGHSGGLHEVEELVDHFAGFALKVLTADKEVQV